ncbi:MAG: glycosyltransferase family 39 protein [Candidatus Daviesbacteria bacterium]|nr:glycosyltransferase family 39 protein [Candidatus Daviesbacteria bacterium]
MLHKEFVIGFILTMSLLWPLFQAQYSTYHDSVQVIRLFEMDKCIRDGQIPCRWVPDLGGEYGYPLFNFYAPLPYYYGEIFYKLTGSLLISSKIMFASAFVLSYIFMFLLGRKLWGEKGGAISAIFFSFAPYHASLFYVRGAMGELWGVMFYPLILWSIFRLKEKQSVLNILLVALSIGGVLVTHNLSALMFLPVIAGFILMLAWQDGGWKFWKKTFFIFVILSAVLGLSLASFYWVPALTEKNLVHVDTTTYGYFHYTEHFKGLRKLFAQRFWGWGASVFEVNGRTDGMAFQVGWVHVLGWALGLFAAYKLWWKDRKISIYVIFFTLSTAFGIFMVNPKSLFIWDALDFLKYVQFSWRFLGIVIFAISVVAGSIILAIPNKISNRVWIGLVFLVVVLNFYYFRPEKFISTTDKELLTGKEWDAQIKRSIFDYLPIYAVEPPAALTATRYEVLTGEVNITNWQQGTNWFNFKANASSHTIVRIAQYYFPNWIILVDNQEVSIDYQNHLGLMTIILGTGSHTVEGRLYDSPVRALTNRLSGLSAILVFILLLFQIPKIRKWSLYYLRRID